MNICSWISTGCFIAFIIAYIVFNIKKNIKLLRIFSIIPLPFIGITTVAILTKYLPDSFHVIMTVILALMFCTAGKILLELSVKNQFLTLGKALYGVSAVFYIMLFRTIFHLHHISQWWSIFAILIAMGISTALILIIKHQKPLFYVTCGVIELITTLFSYIALLTLIFEPELYSILLFAGALLSQAYTTFHLLDVKKLKLKNGKLIKQILLMVSNSLVCSACVFIFVY